MPQGQPVPVHRDDGQPRVVHLKEGAGVDGPGLVVADGEEGLADHGAQGVLLDGEAVFILDTGQLGEVLRVGGQDVEVAHAAGDVDHIAVGRKDHHVVGQFSDDLAEQPGGEDQAAALFDLGRDGGADAGLQVVAGQAQIVSGLQEDALQSGNGAFGGDSPGGGADGGLQKRFFAGKLHGQVPSFLSAVSAFGGEDRIFVETVCRRANFCG